MPTESELKVMTKAGLSKLAEEMGIPLKSKDTKAAIVDKILATPGLDLHMALPPRSGEDDSNSMVALLNRINKIEQTLHELVETQKELIALLKRGGRPGAANAVVDTKLTAGMATQLKGQLQDPLKRWQSGR